MKMKNKTGVKFVSKIRCKDCRQKFTYVYKINRVGLKYKKSSTDLTKLKEKILKDKMPWIEEENTIMR